jgi:hypothetical protein
MIRVGELRLFSEAVLDLLYGEVGIGLHVYLRLTGRSLCI